MGLWRMKDRSFRKNNQVIIQMMKRMTIKYNFAVKFSLFSLIVQSVYNFFDFLMKTSGEAFRFIQSNYFNRIKMIDYALIVLFY